MPGSSAVRTKVVLSAGLSQTKTFWTPSPSLSVSGRQRCCTLSPSGAPTLQQRSPAARSQTRTDGLLRVVARSPDRATTGQPRLLLHLELQLGRLVLLDLDLDTVLVADDVAFLVPDDHAPLADGGVLDLELALLVGDGV